MKPLALLVSVAAVLAAAPATTHTSAPDGAAEAGAVAESVSRETEPVVLTGADFGDWAAPAYQEVKANSLEGAQCTGGVDGPDSPVTSSEPCSHNEYEEPDASTGDVPAEGVPTDRLLGYRWEPELERFVQVPFQVDEMFVRHISNNVSGFSFFSETDRHVTYAFDREGFRWTDSAPGDPCLARPASPVAEDPVSGLDTDDEIAFMWRDTGRQAPADATLPEGITDVREVTVADPTTGQPTYLYVMQADEDGPEPAFDADSGYVRYDRDEHADVFLFSESSYEDYGKAPDGPWYDPEAGVCHDDPDEYRQHRPGDQATITTPRYRFRYEGRWLMTELEVSQSAEGDWTYGPDLIDQWKARAFQQRPGGETPCCGYEEEVNNWGGSSILLGELAGPVRVVRETWGADSGTNVVRREVFYRDEIRFQSFLRVHVIPPLDGIYVQWDHNAATVDTYYNPHVPDGAPIDGKSDEVFGNSQVYAGEEGVAVEDPVLGEIEEATGTDLPDLAVCRPDTDCDGGAFVDNDVDSPDPTFSGVNGLLDWEEVAGPHGTLVTRWWAQQTTPGGAAHAAVTVPYYRDDACFDDGTGTDPGPHVDSRDVDGDEPSDSTWTWENPAGKEIVRDRECWDADRMNNPTYADDLGTKRFYQGSIGTHGLHILAIADSDNAHTTLPITEIDAEERMVVLPGDAGNVGEAYGRGPEFPLQTAVAPMPLAAAAGG